MATVLITGASSGLGAEFAWQLATARHDLVIVARSRDRLDELATSIRSAAGVSVEVLAADLGVESDLERVATRLADASSPISLLVNNAGYGSGRSFLANDWATEKAMIDVMVTAPARLAHAALPGMVARGHGAILNVSSVAAHLANSTYAAHKRWLLDFTHALAGTLAGTGVSASVVIPGLTRTRFHDSPELSHYHDAFPSAAWLSPEDVVTAALAGLRRRTVVVTPSARYRVVGVVARSVPRSVTRRTSAVRRRGRE